LTIPNISIPCLIYVGNFILFSFIFSQFIAELQPLPVSDKVLLLSCMLIKLVWGETDLKSVSNAIIFCRRWPNKLVWLTMPNISIPCLIFVGNLILFSFIFSHFTVKLQPLPMSDKVLLLSCMLIKLVWGDSDLKLYQMLYFFVDGDLIS